jgi:hypothetical protein
VLIQEVFEQVQAQLKETQITAVSAMDDLDPAISGSDCAQVDDPDVGQASRDHQAGQALGVRDMAFVQVEASALLVGEESLDGLITNDKFCFSRWSVLRLSWWRRPLRLRGTESQRCDTLLDGNIHPGGTDGAGMDSSQGSSAVCGRPTPLGSGLPVPPEMGNDDEAGDLVHPNSTGGV